MLDPSLSCRVFRWDMSLRLTDLDRFIEITDQAAVDNAGRLLYFAQELIDGDGFGSKFTLIADDGETRTRLAEISSRPHFDGAPSSDLIAGNQSESVLPYFREPPGLIFDAVRGRVFVPLHSFCHIHYCPLGSYSVLWIAVIEGLPAPDVVRVPRTGAPVNLSPEDPLAAWQNRDALSSD